MWVPGQLLLLTVLFLCLCRLDLGGGGHLLLAALSRRLSVAVSTLSGSRAYGPGVPHLGLQVSGGGRPPSFLLCFHFFLLVPQGCIPALCVWGGRGESMLSAPNCWPSLVLVYLM